MLLAHATLVVLAGAYPRSAAEEMYNPAVSGRSDGGVFTVTARP